MKNMKYILLIIMGLSGSAQGMVSTGGSLSVIVVVPSVGQINTSTSIRFDTTTTVQDLINQATLITQAVAQKLKSQTLTLQVVSLMGCSVSKSALKPVSVSNLLGHQNKNDKILSDLPIPSFVPLFLYITLV